MQYYIIYRMTIVSNQTFCPVPMPPFISLSKYI